MSLAGVEKHREAPGYGNTVAQREGLRITES